MNQMLITLGAVALTAIAFNANADIALSPRAAANQIKTIAAADNVVAAVDSAVALSPRVAANELKTVSGANNDPAFATACRSRMTGSSPKAIQACEANSTMPGCTVANVR